MKGLIKAGNSGHFFVMSVAVFLAEDGEIPARFAACTKFEACLMRMAWAKDLWFGERESGIPCSS
jgi:hypothetical protein